MDTKDITYFLNAEQEFCNTHPTYGKMSINKDSKMTFIGLDDRAYFFIGKSFAKYYHHTNKIIENEEIYGLTLARTSDCVSARTAWFMQPMKVRWWFKAWMAIL